MKQVLLIASVLFSFSALARPEFDRINLAHEMKTQNREVAKTNCPKEKKPSFHVTVANYEFNERLTR